MPTHTEDTKFEDVYDWHHQELQKALEIQAIEIREEEANEYNKIIEQELQKAREEERERNVKLINDIIRNSSDDSSDSWFDALRCARETIAHQSELDQPDALTK